MTAFLVPAPKQQFFDNNGRPLVGGLLYTYEAGTSTKADTYTDSTGMTPNTNPVVLDYRGECNVWIPANVAYKFVLAPSGDTDPPSKAIWTVDQIINSQLLTLYGGVDIGQVNAYALDFVANFSAYTDGIVIYWLASHTNTGPSIIDVNGLGSVPILNPDGSLLFAGEIVAGQMQQIAYLNGSFVLISQSASYQFGVFQGVLGGLSTIFNNPVFYQRIGQLVTLSLSAPFAGTSNDTVLTMTGLPTILRPSQTRTVFSPVMTDNGTTKGGIAVIRQSPTDRIEFYLGIDAGTAWTSSGTKGLGGPWCIVYPL